MNGLGVLEVRVFQRVRAAVSATLLLLALAGPPAQAQTLRHAPGREPGFQERGGEAIYQGICQGCHMPDAQGAVGAGAYPALAGNAHLASKFYPAFVVMNGRKAMPSFAALLDDDQIAAVANYVRSHFGNQYTDAITQAEVKSLRPKPAAVSK